ncbi:hypothetical protein HH308_22410 [Gordonia sp. TBRC 11910]|uniref:Beta-lactamase class A n=1 Tax=Gordonia asplenii TaxID=2725283 RepID=A0A848L0H6_9ACTN|nr:hypothetical protein [Gordonia asplenii]
MSKRLSAMVAILACGAVALSACGQSSGGTTVTVTVTSSTPTSTSTTSAVSPTVSRPAPDAAALKQGWKKLKVSQPVSVSIAAVGNPSARIDLGTPLTEVAWSTIKVPLAIAAERHNNGPLTATTAAIQQSDNASAESLWASLGTAQQASAAVEKVLAEGGVTLDVPTTQLRSGFTVFGQTQWSVHDAATFAAQLPCLPDSSRVLGFMATVAGNQQWGAYAMSTPKATAVKGGWGPGVSSGYVVRQLAVITGKDGRQTAIAMTTSGPGTSLGSGESTLTQVAKWLNTNLKSLPSGTCAR